MPYKTTENFAREIAYIKEPELMPIGKIITKYDPDSNRIIAYKLEAPFHGAGLHGYLFVPIEDDHQPAILTFRGTYDVEGIIRDLDPKGIGVSEFMKHTPELLEKTSKYTNLVVVGHSLGTADCQNYAIARARYEMGRKKDRDLKMDLVLFNAPKLSKDIYYESEKLNSEVQPKIKINLYFAQHEKDKIVRAGYSNIKSGKLFNVHYYEDQTPRWGTVQAHCEHMFCSKEDGKLHRQRARSHSIGADINLDDVSKKVKPDKNEKIKGKLYTNLSKDHEEDRKLSEGRKTVSWLHRKLSYATRPFRKKHFESTKTDATIEQIEKEKVKPDKSEKEVPYAGYSSSIKQLLRSNKSEAVVEEIDESPTRPFSTPLQQESKTDFSRALKTDSRESNTCSLYDF